MQKYMKGFFFALLLIIGCFAIAQAKEIQATQIIVFKPELPKGKAVSGSCWTDSIAINRSGAWRCMIGNSIYDPCFTTDVKNKLVCGADPANKKKGFVLLLDKSLPKSDIVKTTVVRPWVMKLADGSVCKPYTGTIPMTDKGAVPFYCVSHLKNKSSDKCASGLLADSIDQGRVWTAKKIEYCPSKQSKTGLMAKDIKKVNITLVWM